ncbi:MAG: GGDEF domain-containing protein [Alphaproteobacteria bacterium]|jgi:diguanylate cyclase (GGDEF)-like protein|nr:GGDEF domain-containing protein [Alphaproteobacteria bacterium]
MIAGLDFNTLLLVNTLTLGLQAVALAYVWQVHRDYRPTRAWAIGAALAFAGTLPAMYADPAPLLEVAGDGLCFTGIVILASGIVRACGRRPPGIAGFLLAAAATIASGATFVADAPPQCRSFVFALLMVVAHGYAAGCLFSSVPGPLRATCRLIGAVVGLQAAVALLRVSTAWQPADLLGLGSAVSERAFLLATICITFLLVWVLTLLTSRRLQVELIDAARHDPLTGLLNRRAFAEIADREWRRSGRARRTVSALVCDFDHFKLLNDRFGHAAGDDALTAAADILTRTLGGVAAVSRHGGEEFVALLPDIGLDGARLIGEQIRAEVAALTLAAAPGAALSVSIGIAEAGPEHAGWEDLVAEADRALYRAKAAGRDRVVLA